MRFTTTIDAEGKSILGFKIPAEVIESLGKGKRPPVLVTINGYTYRNTVAVYGGVYMVGVSAEHRGPANVKGGDVVEVDLELDTAPRVIEVPEDFAAALADDPLASAAFEALSYSNKSGYTLPIRDAKTPETRQRRIDKAVERLRESRA
jgi:Bacteriocin-protection, YdeI or OmpD-Associated/Domain of unknown function (DUF1905)